MFQFAESKRQSGRQKNSLFVATPLIPYIFNAASRPAKIVLINSVPWTPRLCRPLQEGYGHRGSIITVATQPGVAGCRMKAVLDPRIGHTIVLQRQDEDPLERVLVATPNRKALPLAADVATHLPGRSHRREITVLLFDHGVQAEEPDDAIPAAVGADAGRGGPARSSASVRYETFSGSLSDAVAVRTGDYDRVLVGRSRGLYSRTFGPIPAGILRRCRCPVLFVSSVRTGAGTRARGGRRS